MNAISKIAKFFIVCASIFVVGLFMTIGGLLAGGIHGIDKVAEHYEWFEGSAGEPVVNEYHNMDMKRIDAKGIFDIRIVGPEYYDEIQRKLAKAGYTENIKAQDIFVVYGENTEAPIVTAGDSGRLSITSAETDEPKVTMSFDGEYFVPSVYICVGKDDVEEINIESSSSDIVMKDVSFKQTNIDDDYGDIKLEYVRSKGLKIKSEGGDIILDGEYKGDTILRGDSGDIKFETSLDADKYDTHLIAEYGEIEIGDDDIEIDGEPYTYEKSGGPNKLNINNDSGDIKVWFGDTLF